MNSDLGTDSDVRKCVCHSPTAEGVLEFGTHEPVAISPSFQGLGNGFRTWPCRRRWARQ